MDKGLNGNTEREASEEQIVKDKEKHVWKQSYSKEKKSLA